MRPWFAVMLLVPLATAASGCYCSPETVPTEVILGTTQETVRTLPMLSSGATRVAGISVPDAHGMFAVDVTIESANVTRVDVHDMRLEVTVGASPVPVLIVGVEGGRQWRQHDEGRLWSGVVDDDTTLVAYWVVDRDRAQSVTELVLDEGAAYTARLRFHWEYDTCLIYAAGDVDHEVEGFVRASVNTRTFQPQGEPTLDVAGGTAGFKAQYTVRSGLQVTMRSGTAVAVYYASDDLVDVGVVTFPAVGWSVNGESGNTVSPGQTLQVHSAASATAKAVYGPTGQAAIVGQPDGLFILIVDLHYTSDDETVGATHDLFAYAVDT